MKHRWSEKTRQPNGDSRKICTREGCEIVCVSCHGCDDHGRPDHWKKWFRGSEQIQVGGATPACEAVDAKIINVPLAPKPADVPAQPTAAPLGARRARVLTTETLREHAALQARIETCGDLTRGFFGDPPPGRSALDRLRSLEQGARSAAVANSAEQGACDG